MHWKLHFIAALFAHITIGISGIENIEHQIPTISYLATRFPVNETELKGPADYVQIASNSDVSFVVNTMICRAKNADAIKWEFKKAKNDSFTDIGLDQSNDVITLGALKTLANNEVEMEINDGVHTRQAFLEKLNGYYRCVATNTYGYKALSPTFRVILPYLVGTDVASSAAVGSRVQNQSYVLPCVIAKTVINGGYEIKPADTALFDNSVKFVWYRTYKQGTGQRREILNLDAAERVGRVKLDPLTGDLYFAYLITFDQVTDSTGDSQLQCDTQVGTSRAKTTNIVVQFTVEVATGPIQEFTLEKPIRSDVTGSEKVFRVKEAVKCIAGKQCRITCIFGGIYGKTGKIRGRREGESFFKDGDSAGFSFLAEGTPKMQNWQCELYDEGSDEIHVTVIYEVTMKNYPKLTNFENFEPTRYSKTGEDMRIVCEAAYVEGHNTDFFFNGEEITGDSKNIKYNPSELDTAMEIVGVKKENAGSYLCVTKNEIGSLFATSNVIVYDPAAVVQYPLAKNPYVIESSSKNFTNLFVFNCSITLDVEAKVLKSYWKSNSTVSVGKEITAKDSEGGIKVVNVPIGSGVLTSSLILELDSTSTNIIRDTQWQCVVEYSIFGKIMAPAESDPVLFQIVAPPAPPPPPPPKVPWAIIGGSTGGVVFLVGLLVLIGCYVQKQGGEQYYVDEKERKAGHNPEEEMEAYGFSDYTRPDQNPIKGSRASMNFSDKPMESDTGSLDQYGDIDPGRYNEDGSFIGQYGQNQADV